MGTWSDDPAVETFGADDPVVHPVGAGESAVRGFVGGGGALLKALGAFESTINPQAWADKIIGIPREDVASELGARAEDYANLTPSEIPTDLTARVAGAGARVAPQLAAAIGTGGEAGVESAAARGVPYLGRLLDALVKGAPTAGSLTAIQGADLPDTLTPGEKAAELGKTAAINLGMAGLPAAVGESPLVRALTGGAIGAGTSAGVTALEGQDQDAAQNIIGALMGTALGAAPHGAPLPESIRPEDVDAFLRTAGTEVQPAAPAAAESRALPADAIENGDFNEIVRAMLPEPARALPVPAAQPEALPAPVVTVDRAGDARTSGSFMDELLAGLNDARTRAELGITPGTVRAIAAHEARTGEPLTQQRADDSPPWWLAGPAGEADVLGSRIANTDQPPPAPAPKPVAPQAEGGRAATELGTNVPESGIPARAQRGAERNPQPEVDANVQPRTDRAAPPAAGEGDSARVVPVGNERPAEKMPARTEPAANEDDTPEPPIEIRYGKRRLPTKLPTTPPAERAAESTDVQELSSADLTPEERAAFERQSAPRELTDADLTPAERASFERQRAAPAERAANRELTDQMAAQSRTEGEAQADRAGLRAATQDVLGGAEGAPKVEFLSNYDGLPDHLRGDIENRNSTGRAGRTAALYDPKTGRVFMFTDAVKTPEAAAWHAAHEIAGHVGLRGLIGERAGATVGSRTAREALDTALDMARQNPTVAKLADEIGRQRKSGDQRTMAEEALAELAAATRTGNWDHIKDRYGVDVPEGVRDGAKTAVRRFIERIKALLAKLFKKARFSDADVHKLVEDAWQYVRRPRERVTERAAEREAPRGSVAEPSDKVKQDGRLFNDSESPEREESRESDRGDITDTPAFRRWFGNSQIVDDGGHPRVMYHARRSGNDFDTFRSDRPIFFADTKSGAARAASASSPHDYVEAYLRAEHPANTPETPVHFMDVTRTLRDNPNADSVYVEDESGVSIAVRDPSQIKSAMKNNGAFDSENPSILESVAADSSDIPKPEREREAPSRRPGESQRAYARRVMRTSKEAIAEATKIAKHQQKIGRANFRAMLAQQARAMDVADAAFAEARKLFDETPKAINLATIDAWENGRPVKDIDARDFFDSMQAGFDQRVARIRELAPDALQQLIENYFPHIWEDSAKAAKWYQGFAAKRPLEGNRAFLKQRTWGTIKEGMASGLKPVSTNPVDLVLLKYQQMDKFIAFHEFRKDLQERGWLKEMSAGERAPDGYARVDDPAFQKAGGLQGYYAVPELVAKDVNNYLAPSLYRFSAWKSLRAVQNTIMSARLGMSMFHAGFTTLDNLVQHVGVGMQRAAEGDIAGSLNTILHGLVSPVGAPLEGNRLIKQWLGQSQADPHTSAMLHLLEQGGARMTMSPTDYNNSLREVTRRVRRRELNAGTVGHALSAVGELSGWIIHRWLVPRQKMAARVMLLKFELDHFAKQLGKERGDYAGIIDAMHPDVAKQLSGKVVDAVDNRLGQMTYDNQFWNKTVREVSQAIIGAVGWQVGTVRTVTGGLRDIPRVFKPEELVATLDKAEKITGARMSRFGGNLANLIALGLVIGGADAVLQYLLSGNGPTEPKDYFIPKTGRRNPDDSEERLQLPTYWMDHYKLATHPLQTASHKLHPSISMLMEILSNKDYYGTQIRNPDESLHEQAEDIAKFVAKGFLPYSISNQSQLAETDSGAGERVSNFFGVTRAPASVSRSKFQSFVAEKAYASLPRGSRTQEEADHSDLMHAVEDQLRRGMQPDWGDLSAKDRKNALKAAEHQVPEIRFRRLGIEDKLRAYDMATTDERERYHLRAIILRSDLSRSSTFQRLPEDEKQAVRERIAAIRHEPASIGAD